MKTVEHWIGGTSTPGSSTRTAEVYNPATGQVQALGGATGHLAYGRADSVEIITRFPSRIGYVHIKQMDPAILAKAEAEDLSFGRAVAMGASCEPPYGLPDIPPVLAALDGLDAELFTVVEQDMYPCDFAKPKPIAARTCAYLNSLGLGGHDGGAA